MESLSTLSLPPGFGFHPTDVELISHYLKGKILGQNFEADVIPEVDIYKHEPWDLPEKSQIPTRDYKWHFFTSRDRKYPNGSRSNRATETGYWKSTGKDRNVRLNNRIIGTKKTLVFHEGKPPYGKRTDWIMHEYYLNENEYKTVPIKDRFVLCRITKRNGLVKEDKMLNQVENKISPCAPLPNACFLKDLQGASLQPIPKEEICSPSENLDYEAWFEELYDPYFFGVPSDETRSENKDNCLQVDTGSPVINHHLEELLPHEDETYISIPEHGIYGFLENPFSNGNLVGESNAIYKHNLQSEFGVDYLSHPSHVTVCTEDEVLMNIPPTAVHQGTMYPCEEPIATPVSKFRGQQNTVDTGIQIREHCKCPDEIPRHPHKVHLQVHKMESRNPVPPQTFVFVSEDSHLDMAYQLEDEHIPSDRETKLAVSGAFSALQYRKTSTNYHVKLPCENSSPALFSQHSAESQGSTSRNKELEDPLPRQFSEKMGPDYYPTMSPKQPPRKMRGTQSCDRSGFSLKPPTRSSKSNGFLCGICTFLHECSSVGLNCLVAATCMIGTAGLIAFLSVRDARWFLRSSHILDL